MNFLLAILLLCSPQEHETKHYQLRAEGIDVEDTGRLLEELHKQLKTIFGKAPKGKLKVEVWSTEERWADSIRKDDLAARVGGDEFVLWLEGALGRDAVARAESLLEGSSSLGRFSGDEAHPLTVSIGVAAITAKDDCDLADLMHRVDQAMYRAKRNGKNNVALAESPRASEDGDEEC